MTHKLTAAEMWEQLDDKLARLEELTAERERVQSELHRIDAEIRKIAPARDSAHPDIRSRRTRNKMSLRKYVAAILTQYDDGLTLADLAEKVKKAGYVSHSRNFRNVLYQCLYNADDIEHRPETGTYVLICGDANKD